MLRALIAIGSTLGLPLWLEDDSPSAPIPPAGFNIGAEVSPSGTGSSFGFSLLQFDDPVEGEAGPSSASRGRAQDTQGMRSDPRPDQSHTGPDAGPSAEHEMQE